MKKIVLTVTILALLVAMTQAQRYGYRGYPAYNYGHYPVRPYYNPRENDVQPSYYRRPYYQQRRTYYRNRYYTDDDSDDDWDD